MAKTGSSQWSIRSHKKRGQVFLNFVPIRVLFAALGCASCFLLSGCQGPMERPESKPVVTPQQKAAERKLLDAEEEITQQQRQIMLLELRLLASEAEVKKLVALQEEAVQEIVRINARVRSGRSKAEVVASLAEVKLALAQRAGRNARPPKGFERANNYVLMSEEALAQNNLDGASYLIKQAWSALSARAQGVALSTAKPNDSNRFTKPLMLRINRWANLRKQPGVSSQILGKLKPGSNISAIAYKGLWVNVREASGREGWVHYRLMRTPEGI